MFCLRDDQVEVLPRAAVVLGADDECAVQLDEIRSQGRQVLQAGKARPHVVHGRSHPARSVVIQDVLEPLHVRDVFRFHDLEYQAGQIGAALLCRLHRGPQADLRVVDSVWHEVDEQAHVGQVQGGGIADRHLPRPLVQHMFQVQLDRGVNDRSGPDDLLGLRMPGADEGLVREYGAGPSVHDRVEEAEQPAVIERVSHPVVFGALDQVRQRLGLNKRGQGAGRVVQITGEKDACHVQSGRFRQALQERRRQARDAGPQRGQGEDVFPDTVRRVGGVQTPDQGLADIVVVRS